MRRRSIIKGAGALVAALGLSAFSGAAMADAPTLTPVPGQPTLLLGNFNAAAAGYSVEEFFYSGTATSYQSQNGQVTAAATSPYATRLVVIRPTDASKFNGTVIVEWMNVTGGQDVPTEWIIAHRELLRSGYAFVGVSAQKVGVEGGGNGMMGAGTPLKRANPTRYGVLSHPGDAFSFDMFSQAGALLRGPNAAALLGPLTPRAFIAAGESQSAVYLTTYVSAIDPIARVYDGFLIHSRFGAGAPLDGTSMASIPPEQRVPVTFQNLRVPVLTVVTETDLIDGRLLGFRHARQPDSSHFRTWEIAGAAHADNYLFGLGMMDSGSLTTAQLAHGFAPLTATPAGQFPKAINTGLPHHYVMQAAIAAINNWVRTGHAPARAHPLQLASDQSSYKLDANGNARGGVRTPWLDAPIMKLSGAGNSGSPLATLVGSSEPFDAATLHRLYPNGRDQYLSRFGAALNGSIRHGFLLDADKQEILAIAATSYPTTP